MRTVLEERIDAWLDDPESQVVYAEELDHRWAVRMRQETREATTVWFSVGERSLEFEAYVMPVDEAAKSVLHQALLRNVRSWRVFFALNATGGLVLRGRISSAAVTIEELDFVLGEIYETVEVAFRPLLKAMTEDREKSS